VAAQPSAPAITPPAPPISLRRTRRDVAGAAFRDSTDLWRNRAVDFLTGGLSPRPEATGAWLAIRGTLLISALVAVVAFPLGVGAAVYLEEYARNTRWTRLVSTNIRNLAGVPSIVYGLLGLAIFVNALGELTGGRSVVSAGLTMSVLVLPIVIITAGEALRAVPRGIREAALGLGATRWEVVRSHVLPAAAPGILTGTILALARAAGEAAPLILVGAVTLFYSTGNQGQMEQLYGSFTALPMVIFGWARQPGNEWQVLTAAASVLLVAVLLAMNGIAIFLRNRYERKW
jgi:phosphate transport system permease protein